MAAQNLDATATFTFSAEGDDTVTGDPEDGGCWSSGSPGVGTLIGCRYGVSAATLISWMPTVHVTPAVMAALPKATAEAIFGARYWQAVNGDALPPGVDLSVVDMAFNAGDAPSVKLLQELLGFGGDYVDGWCGPDTISAFKNFPFNTFVPHLSKFSAQRVQGYVGVKADGDIGPVSMAAINARQDKTFILCAALADAQLAHYRSLANWSLYGAGWTNRTWARLSAALKLCPLETSS